MKNTSRIQVGAGLIGAVAVASASQAYGGVVSVKAPANIPGNAPSTTGTLEYWNVATGTTTSAATAATDFALGYGDFSTTGGGAVLESVGYGYTGKFAGKTYSYTAPNGKTYANTYAFSIPKGATIGTAGKYAAFAQTAGQVTFLSLNYNGTDYGNLPVGTPGYVGFQFTAADGLLHDGWLELETDPYTSAASPGGLTFLGAAYNTTPDAQGGIIAAGDTGTSSVPEPGSLSALAIGAIGLTGVGRGRRRAAASAASN